MQKAVLLFFCFLLLLSPVPAFAEDGDFLGDQVTYEEPNFMEKMLAKIFAGIAYVLIKVLGLKDINTLVFQSEHKSLFGQEYEMVYNTFTANMWEAINRFYESFSDVSCYLLFIGIVVWAFLFLLQAADPEGQSAMRDFFAGIVIFILGMYFAGNIVKVFFEVNNFFVGWSVQVLRTYNFDPYTTDYVESLLTRVIDSSPFGLETPGAALLFFVAVCVVAILNYQYTIRLFVLGSLIILLPVVLYASVFPASRKAFDIWAREFAVQAWMPGIHSIAFAFFYALVSTWEDSGLGFLALLCILLGLLSITQLIRIVLGAPGGKFSGSLGFGSAAAISMILKNIRGRSVRATANFTPAAGAGMPNMSTNMAGGRGLTLGLMARGTPSFTGSGGSFAAKALSTTGGMVAGSALGLAATAVTGNLEVGVLGAAKGYEIGKGVTSAVTNTVSSARNAWRNVRASSAYPGSHISGETNLNSGITQPPLFSGKSQLTVMPTSSVTGHAVPLTNRAKEVLGIPANRPAVLRSGQTANGTVARKENVLVTMTSNNVRKQTSVPTHAPTVPATMPQNPDKVQITPSQPHVNLSSPQSIGAYQQQPIQERIPYPQKMTQQPKQPPVLPSAQSAQQINTALPNLPTTKLPNLQNTKKEE